MSKDILKKALEKGKGNHYNLNEKELEAKKNEKEIIIPTGSLKFDLAIGGGFKAGFHRFIGASEAGKTSQALLLMNNFLSGGENRMGLYVKSEGRLSADLMSRSGVHFVELAEEWEDQSCFILKSNNTEFVFDFVRSILGQKKGPKYFIIFDSGDGFMADGDMDKSSGENLKVASGANLTGDLLKRISLDLSEGGHFLFSLGQVRAKPKLNLYAPGETNLDIPASGGNASIHYADWILQALKPRVADLILETPKAQISDDNKKLGHNARWKVWKSTNETTGETIEYPVKKGGQGKKAIWVEKEIVDLLIMWGFIEKKASWFALSQEVKEILGVDSDSIQGMDKIQLLIEERPENIESLRELIEKQIKT
jgi:RecA/RadA recombinase